GPGPDGHRCGGDPPQRTRVQSEAAEPDPVVDQRRVRRGRGRRHRRPRFARAAARGGPSRDPPPRAGGPGCERPGRGRGDGRRRGRRGGRRDGPRSADRIRGSRDGRRAGPRGARAARRTGKLGRDSARLICDSLYRLAVPDRLPPPGPSFLREQRLDVGDRHLSVGMSRPTTTEDEWWLAIVWVADAEGIVSFVDLAPAAGPRPEPPLTRLGPSLAGALSGLI